MTVVTQNGEQVADFELGFVLDGKATVEEDDGTLYIKGYASDFEVDRQDEAFEPGAFEDGLKSYMATNPVMLYHHKMDTLLGSFDKAEIHAGKGLWVEGRVPKPTESSPTLNYYNQIKNGILKGFSVGGKFYRRMTADGPRIHKCDLREISVTPMPVNPRTLFAVGAKAFEDAAPMETETQSDDQVTISKDEYKSLLNIALNVLENQVAEQEAELSFKSFEVTDEALSAAAEAVADEKAVKSGKTTRTAAARSTNVSADAPQHPDRHQVANLLLHQQKVANLAHQLLGSSDDKGVKQAVAPIAKSARKHTADLHHLAANIGPLPDYYSA